MISNLVALMPLRGGSKSIPKKNIKAIAGKPLCYWGLQSAIESGIFSSIYVSTDCLEIKATIFELFKGVVQVIDRPAEYAQDTSSTEEVMMYFMSQISFDALCLIQATSPLTSHEDFIKAWTVFSSQNADSLVTTVPSKRFFWNSDGAAINYDPLRRPRRQDFAGWLMENGAFYFTKRTILEKHKCRLGGKIVPYVMDEIHSVEIDEPADWYVMEGLIRRHRNPSTKAAGNVKMIAVDVDGTLTDGGMYYNADGEFLKKFNTKDAHGLKRLERHGIKIVIITAETSSVVTARMKKLEFHDYHHGIKNKLSLLKKISGDHRIPLSEIAYVGDDEGDLECMGAVGFATCPSDAMDEIKSKAHFISSLQGGQGAVREICDFILKNQYVN